MKVKPAKHSGQVVLEVSRGDETLLKAGSDGPIRLKSILVPTDFSECSKKALRYALALAKQYDAAITLLFVVPTPAFAAGEYGLIDYAAVETGMRASGEKELAALAAGIGRDQGPVSTEVRTGSPASEIVELAKSLRSDMIVISTHGHTGLKHVLLGSVAEHVVRHAPCPVLVVREQEREFLKK